MFGENQVMNLLFDGISKINKMKSDSKYKKLENDSNINVDNSSLYRSEIIDDNKITNDISDELYTNYSTTPSNLELMNDYSPVLNDSSSTLEKEYKKNKEDDNSELIIESIFLVVDKLDPLVEISESLKQLVNISNKQLSDQEQLNEQLEIDRENKSIRESESYKESKSYNGIEQLKTNSIKLDTKSATNTILGGFPSIITMGMTSLVSGLGWAVVDGLLGFLKSDKWGVSNIAGVIGGFFGGTGDNLVMRTVGNMGKWALIGAGIGSMVPVVGTAIGGLVGALIGGLLGWIGGQNLSVFFDDFGVWISNSFSNGLMSIQNFFLDIWDTIRNMVDSVSDIIDNVKLSMVGWIKNILNWLLEMDPTGLAGELLNPVVESFQNKQKEIENKVRERSESRNQRDIEADNRDNKLKEQKEQQILDNTKRVQTRTNRKLDNISSEQLIATPMQKMSGRQSNGQSLSVGDNKRAVIAELQSKGIVDPVEQANILANLQGESNFKAQSENLNYSAKTLLKLYGPGSGNKVRVKDLEDAQAIVDKGPEAIGNLIYGGRMGNSQDEGYKYRGRGLVQLTGKDNYEQMSQKLGIDLVNNPDLVNDPEIAVKVAAQYYSDRKNKFNYKDISQVSKATGHAAGHNETLKRAMYAKQIKSEIDSGSLNTSNMMLASLQADNELVANSGYKTLAQSSNSQKHAQIVNVSNNIDNSKNIQNGSTRSNTSNNESHGTSSRTQSFLRAALT
jgi:predicted chitinase